MNNFRLVFLADTHLGFDYPIKPRIQKRRRGPDFFENFKRVLDYARESRPDLVIHGGDLFFRARIPQKIVDMVYADLFEFAGEGIPILIVPGNHERSILPSSLFLNHPNIYVFDEPKTIFFKMGEEAIGFSGFPCERKTVRDQFSTLLKESGWSNNNGVVKLLCLHQTVEGAQVGTNNYTFHRGKDVIRRIDLPKDATAVLSGHIHRAQILGDLENPAHDLPLVIYPGSIERTSFAERNEKKGFYEIMFAPSERGDWGIEHWKFIELPARPMVDLFLDNTVNEGNLGKFIRSSIENMDADSIIRLRCKPGTDPEVMTMLTGRFLRKTLPDTMNYQFSVDFRQNIRKI